MVDTHHSMSAKRNKHLSISTETTPLLSSAPSDAHDDVSKESVSRWRFWDSRAVSYRFYALALVTLIPIGGHVVKSSLGSLQPLMLHDTQWPVKMTHTRFGLFQSVVSVPNLVVPFLGGLWLDLRGSKPATLAALSFCVVGHMLFSTAIGMHSYTFALIARALFGLGQGNTVVSQGRIAAKWFVGRELVLAVALTESTHNIANFIGAVYTVPITTLTGDYVYALWFGVIICCLSLVAGVVLFATTDESTADNKMHGEMAYHKLLCNTCVTQAHDTIDGIDSQFKRRARFNSMDCDEIVSEQPSPRLSDFVDIKSRTSIMRFGSIGRISIGFLLLCIVHMLFSNVNHLFTYVLANMMATDWNYSLNAAALLSGLSSLIAIFLCPVLGLLFDRVGHKMHACTAAGVVSAIAYLLLAYAKDIIHPAVPLIMLAVSMSFVPTVLRSAVPGLVPPVLYGTAYGLYSVCESIGAVVGHSFVGYVRDKHQDYHVNLVIFAALALLASLLAALLSAQNRRTGGDLNRPSVHHHHTHNGVLPHAGDTPSKVPAKNCPCICHNKNIDVNSFHEVQSAK